MMVLRGMEGMGMRGMNRTKDETEMGTASIESNRFRA